MIDIFIPGRPAPQGSKRHVGGGIMVESCKNVKPWRESIRSALIAGNGTPIERIIGGVICDLEFVMPRPAGAPKRSTPAATKRPDLDKLSRAALDAITSSGVIEDDSRVIELKARKRIAERDDTPGLKLMLKGAEA